MSCTWYRTWVTSRSLGRRGTNRAAESSGRPGGRICPRRPRSLLRLEEFEPRVTPSCSTGLLAQVLTVSCDSSTNTVIVDHNSAITTVDGVDFADSTFNSIQINIGAGPGTVDLFRTPARPLSVNEAGPGAVSVNVSPTVHNLDVIQGAVSITGGFGFHTLVVNDQQAPFVPLIYTMTATSLTRTGGANAINFGTQMHLLTLTGGGAANTYNVTGTGGLDVTTLNTGGGNDTINVENATSPLSVNEQLSGNDTVNVSPSAQNLDNIHAGVTVAGNSGTDTLNFNDQSNAMGRTYTMTATSMHRDGAAAIDFGTLMNFVNLNGGSGVNTYNITGTGGLNLTTLRTGGGNDTINVENTTRLLSVNEQLSGNDTVNVSPVARILNHIQGAVSIAGNAGNDTLIVNDQNDTVGLTYTVTATSIAEIGSATITFGTGMNSVTLNGSLGDDIYNITGTGGRVFNSVQTSIVNNGNPDFVNILATTHPLTVNLGRRGAQVNVSSTAHDLNTIQGNVTINTSTNSGVVNVDDQGNTSSGLTYTLTSNSVTRTGAALISHSPVFEVVVNAATETRGNIYNVTGTQPGFNFLNLHHGATSGDDIVNVQATSGPLNVNGGLSDRVNVGNSGGVQDIRGDLVLLGITILTVNDSPDTVARSVTMAVNSLGDATISGLAPAVITYGQNNIAGVTVDGGSGGNTFNVQGTVTNGLLPITTVNSGSGNDTINVGDTSNTINEIRGALTVNGQAGFDILNINDQGSPIAHHYTVTATTVVRSRPAEPTITITYADIESLNLHPGAHFGPGPANVIDVLSIDANTAVAVDAGAGATVNVGNDRDGLDELQGPLAVGGDGTVALNINDQMTGAGQEYDLMQNELDRSDAAPIAFSNLQSEVLNGGAKGNLFDVDGVAQGIPATLNAGKGGDLVRMRQHDLIQDALTLNGQGNTAVGYVAYTTDVFVDLQLGVATDIAGFSGLSRITGGGGNNILVGDGNEDILGGSGRNLIISGGGTGQIAGGGQGDILIGGTTAYDQDFNSLQAILAYWTGSSDDYATRVANLRAGNGVPQLEAQITVFDGGAANTITGNGDQTLGIFNLFYVTEAGTVTDQQPDEVVVDIDAGPNAPQGGVAAGFTAAVGARLPHTTAPDAPFRNAMALAPRVAPLVSDAMAADLIWQTTQKTGLRGPSLAAELAWADAWQPSMPWDGDPG